MPRARANPPAAKHNNVCIASIAWSLGSLMFCHSLSDIVIERFMGSQVQFRMEVRRHHRRHSRNRHHHRHLHQHHRSHGSLHIPHP